MERIERARKALFVMLSQS